MRRIPWIYPVVLAGLVAASPLAQGQRQSPASKADEARIERLKQQAGEDVDAMSTFTQQMVDQIFSFGELGFQEVETHRYLVDVLRKNGFTVQEGIAGIPTAFRSFWIASACRWYAALLASHITVFSLSGTPPA